MKKTILCTCAFVALSACTPTMATRGNMLKDYQIASVVPGTDTQSDILRKLGSPTTRAPFDDNIWYYMGQETEKRGILDAEIDKEQVIQVTFNPEGTVTDIRNVTQKRSDIPFARDKTPTTGSEMTVMQQLLGNLGRFNKDPNAKPSSVDQGGGKN